MIISRDQILLRIRSEYVEMPGLRLTDAQAQRLWGQFLYRRADGTYARVTEGPAGVPLTRMAKAVQTSAPLPLPQPVSGREP